MANSFTKVLNAIKKRFTYEPSSEIHSFILEEASTPKPKTIESELAHSANELQAIRRLARRVEKALVQTQTILTSDLSPDKVKAFQKELQSLNA